jgi:hypothetical protein
MASIIKTLNGENLSGGTDAKEVNYFVRTTAQLNSIEDYRSENGSALSCRVFLCHPVFV